MNRLQFLLTAKTQYNIQSPFLFELYSEVIAPKLDRTTLHRLGINHRDRFWQLHHKLQDHYGISPTILTSENQEIINSSHSDRSAIIMFRNPHRNKLSEQQWKKIIKEPCVTLSVDLFYTGLAFTSTKLSKQHILLR